MSGLYWLKMQPLSKLKSHPLIPDAHPLRRPGDPLHTFVSTHTRSVDLCSTTLWWACVISHIAPQLKQTVHQVWHFSSQNVCMTIKNSQII